MLAASSAMAPHGAGEVKEDNTLSTNPDRQDNTTHYVADDDGCSLDSTISTNFERQDNRRIQIELVSLI